LILVVSYELEILSGDAGFWHVENDAVTTLEEGWELLDSARREDPELTFRLVKVTREVVEERKSRNMNQHIEVKLADDRVVSCPEVCLSPSDIEAEDELWHTHGFRSLTVLRRGEARGWVPGDAAAIAGFYQQIRPVQK